MPEAKNRPEHLTLSVVTPTYRRPSETVDLLRSLSAQGLLPDEVVIVDGAPVEEKETELAVARMRDDLPFEVRYIRHGGGTAIQRNVGIEEARGDLVAFFDDDIRPDQDFLSRIAEAFTADEKKEIGGIVGYRRNEHFSPDKVERWRWYRRLKLLSTYEPGRYDFQSGYPINANMQPPFSGLREVDFMTTACAVWRREVLEEGLRFDEFFCDYGVLEDAHFSLRARRRWKLMQCGDARCVHLASPGGRADRRKIGYKYVVNYYYVFQEAAGPLRFGNKARFWTFQMFELFRIGASFVRRRRRSDWRELLGRLDGISAVARGVAFKG